jgi:flagellar assembly protein FliH
MTSSSKAFPNVPPPTGAKAPGNYARFIPREELGSFAAWQPGEIDGAQVERRAQPRAEGAGAPTPQQWREQVAQARATGYQDGYRDGLVALESFQQSFAAQATAQVGMLVKAFDEQLTALEGEMAQAIAHSAVLLARQVVRHEIATRPEQLAVLAQEAIDAVMLSARQIVVRVHPEDLDLVRDGAAEVLAERGARVVADAGVQRGGCLVDSEAGAVDATLAARWAQVASALGSGIAWDDEADPSTK